MPRGSETVLVVEDDSLIRSLAIRILESLGYSVLAAADGLDAFEKVKEFEAPIDLVVSDVMMPQLQGPEFVSKARELRSDFRVLYTSGYTRDSFSDAFDRFESERDAKLLPKPYTPQQLAAQVRGILDEAA